MTAIDAAPVEKNERWARWKRIGLDVFRTFSATDVSLRCAGTAFFGFLSVFPAIATVVLIWGLIADRKLLVETFKSLDFILPQSAMGIVGEQLLALTSAPPVSLGLGLLVSIPLALWSGSRGVDAMLYAISSVRGEPPKRSFIKTAAIAVGLTVLASVLLVAALITIAGLPAITSLFPFPSVSELLILAVRWPILLAISVAVLGPLYRWGPDRHPRDWRYIWPGAVLASVLWIVAGLVFSIYVQNWGNYNATFGSVAAAVVLLLWMYNSAQIFVLGAAFNAALERDAKPALAAHAPVAPLGATQAPVVVTSPRHPATMAERLQPKLPWIGLAVAVATLFVAALAVPVDNFEDEL